MMVMLRVPAIGERTGRFLIAVLLFVKLVLLVWNAHAYDGRTYNEGHQADRAVFSGLNPSRLAYDPPLYYLPLELAQRPEGVPQVERHATSAEDAPRRRRARAGPVEREYRAHLLDLLRYSNVLWIAVFYLGWIGYAFPRLLGRGQRWFLASLLLLALPGYQKLAAMSHPENAFAAASTLAVCAWLKLRERWHESTTEPAPTPDRDATSRHSDLWLGALALSIGLLALTRPTAIVPVGILTLVALVYAARFAAQRAKLFLPRAFLIALVVLVLGGGWYVLRWQRTGAVAQFMTEDVAAQAQPRRAGFDYVEYFASFRGLALLETPNASMGAEPRAARADSFSTLLYSEVWGDHWLSFSGPKGEERKVWPKRMILATALLLPAVLGLVAGFWLFDTVKRAQGIWLSIAAGFVRRVTALAAALEVELVLLCWSVLGAALFVYWQAGPALLPGDQQSLKFIHVSTLFPPAIALLFSRPLARAHGTLLAGYLLVLYCAAFPVAMYYPS